MTRKFLSHLVRVRPNSDFMVLDEYSTNVKQLVLSFDYLDLH